MLTYYLGAGASANALPIVRDFFDWNFDIDSRTPESSDMRRFSDANQILAAKIANTIKLSKQFWSIDTYAKSVKHNPQKYHLLKRIIQHYLWHKESFNQPDTRYGLLFQSIIDTEPNKTKARIPVNFISWNYDIQIERSLFNLLGSNNGASIDKVISVNKYLNSAPFNLCKLNGSIFDINAHSLAQIVTYFQRLNDYPHVFNDVVKSISNEEKNGIDCPIKFAWESNSHEAISCALELIQKTTKLVIIGYSFPDFNSDIDREILQKLPLSASIYIQCSPENSNSENEVVKLRIKELLRQGISHQITLVPSVSRFFMPYLKPSEFAVLHK